MINQQLLNPKSIVVVGGSNNVHKPGGSIVRNIIGGGFSGPLHIVNPKEDEVQGIKAVHDVKDIPQTDLAVLVVAARFCPDYVDYLCAEKGVRAFVIISAGFGEETKEGAVLEQRILDTCEKFGAALIGPNCIGLLNRNHHSVFTLPIPQLNPQGVDFISGSGATAVFILESAVIKGLQFNSVWSIGNGKQIGIEDVLMYMDEHFNPETDSKVKLLYIENISNPDKLLFHACSLIRKGCRIAAIKAGSSESGSRAASSHTGAIASSDSAVEALFRKAGIVRCFSREELTTVGCIFTLPPLKGRNFAIVTHAGGPGVMLTDALSKGGLNVPHIEGPLAEELKTKLFPGSSVANPIDFLATGTPEQLGTVIDYCENKFDHIDAIAVIYGTPGLTQLYEAYDVLDKKIRECKKPIFPVLPSIINVKDEIEDFIAKGRINFPEECVLGNAICKVYNTPKPQPENVEMPKIDTARIRKCIDSCDNGYIGPDKIYELLDAAGIAQKQIRVVDKKQQALDFANEVGYPLVMKVVGPVHKSDVGGVTLNVRDIETVGKEFDRLMAIKDTYAVEMYPMLDGTEVYIGAIRDAKFGHQVFFGLGGIFIEVLKDVQSSLVPISAAEAKDMLTKLRGYKILQGVRGQQPVNVDVYAEQIARVAALVMAAPEIAEMDLNPLLGNPKNVVAVDARIRIEK